MLHLVGSESLGTTCIIANTAHHSPARTQSSITCLAYNSDHARAACAKGEVERALEPLESDEQRTKHTMPCRWPEMLDRLEFEALAPTDTSLRSSLLGGMFEGLARR